MEKLVCVILYRQMKITSNSVSLQKEHWSFPGVSVKSIVFFFHFSAKTIAALRLPVMARNRVKSLGNWPRQKSIGSLHHRLGHRKRGAKGKVNFAFNWIIRHLSFAVLGQNWPNPLRWNVSQIHENDGFAAKFANGKCMQYASVARAYDSIKWPIAGRFCRQYN